MKPLIAHFEAESDPAQRRELAAEFNRAAFGFPVIWNMERSRR